MLNNELANNVFSKPQDHAVLLVYADLLEENNHDKLASDLRLFGLFDTKYKMPCRYDGCNDGYGDGGDSRYGGGGHYGYGDGGDGYFGDGGGYGYFGDGDGHGGNGGG
jgi:uncharacterized protein (TIGR02996 family)